MRRYTQVELKMNIEKFLKTVGFLQGYSDIKTTVPRFDFEMCSERKQSKPFGKIWRSVLILWGGPPQINQCMGNTEFKGYYKTNIMFLLIQLLQHWIG